MIKRIRDFSPRKISEIQRASRIKVRTSMAEHEKRIRELWGDETLGR